jgi:hypothetical protein
MRAERRESRCHPLVRHRPAPADDGPRRSVGRSCVTSVCSLVTFGCQTAHREGRGARTQNAPPAEVQAGRRSRSRKPADVGRALARVPSRPGSCTVSVSIDRVLRVSADSPMRERVRRATEAAGHARDAARARPGGPGLSQRFAGEGAGQWHGAMVSVSTGARPCAKMRHEPPEKGNRVADGLSAARTLWSEWPPTRLRVRANRLVIIGTRLPGRQVYQRPTGLSSASFAHVAHLSSRPSCDAIASDPRHPDYAAAVRKGNGDVRDRSIPTSPMSAARAWPRAVPNRA